VLRYISTYVDSDESRMTLSFHDERIGHCFFASVTFSNALSRLWSIDKEGKG